MSTNPQKLDTINPMETLDGRYTVQVLQHHINPTKTIPRDTMAVLLIPKHPVAVSRVDLYQYNGVSYTNNDENMRLVNVEPKLDITKPLQTADGEYLAEILRQGVKISPNVPMMAVLLTDTSSGRQSVNMYRKDGNPYPLHDSKMRLVNVAPPAPEVKTKTLWMNIGTKYSPEEVVGHPTKDQANRRASPARKACIKVTYTEGQFDD